DAIELGALSTTSNVAKITELGVKAAKEDDTEDEESKVEDESIETTKSKFRSDTKCLLEKATHPISPTWLRPLPACYRSALPWCSPKLTRSSCMLQPHISARSGPLFEAYKGATGVEGHSYGKEGTRDFYRLFVIDKAIPVVYEEHEGATEADQKYGNKTRTTIDHTLKVGQVLYWLNQESKSTWSTPRQAPQAKTRWRWRCKIVKGHRIDRGSRW
ncbi:hypothetical protein D6D01_06466, partial [Aureobasidium pullulans]